MIDTREMVANIDREVIANLDVEKDVADTKLTAQLQPTYFTNGELLPWKGRWHRVALQEVNGEQLLTLVIVKPTAQAVKRAEKAARWNEQHASKPGVRRELAALARQLNRGGGRLFGSPESSPAQA